jgi:ATP-binding cassette subfamily C protein LapB
MMKPILALPARGHSPADAPAREAGPLALTFDDVWFSYEENGPAVLEDATLDIRPGEIIALTGGDGIGKSTVARLAAGQLTPGCGLVLLGGDDIGAALAADRGAVAMVDGSNAIVRGSVLSNLTMFRDAERLDAALEAVRLIGLQADINRLPRGFDTPLGGAASETLPTSLLRRIAIARAMAGSPGLLILDEVNNGFDHASELALSQGLLALKERMTIIIVTNRPSFARIADRQFTLSGGFFRPIVYAEPKALAYAAGETA